MKELRLYTFVNFYLSQIQQGIQTAHIVSEMMANVGASTETISTDPLVQKVTLSEADIMVSDWAEECKTIIVCNGGNADALIDMIDVFTEPENPYPWAMFNEDEQSLSGALTACGIILPEDIYDAYYDVEGDMYLYDGDGVGAGAAFYNEGSYEYTLLKAVKSKRLA